MKTYSVGSLDGEKSGVETAVALLEEGHLVVLPTDTGYALAGLAEDEDLLARIYRSKGRSLDKPIHILLSSPGDAKNWVVWEKRADLLADLFLPGPLTLVLPAQKHVPSGLNSRGQTLGVRVPDFPFTLAVLSHLGRPITATSANPSGQGGVFRQADLGRAASLDYVSAIFDAGDLPHTAPSTVVELLPDRPFRLIRKGPISRDELQRAFQEVES